MDGSDAVAAAGELAGRTVAVTAERRAEDQAELFRKRGAHVVIAPTVHTVELSGDDELRAVTESVIADPPDRLVATTGFGMRLWFDAAEAWGLDQALLGALATAQVVARGPKAQSVCRQRGLEVAWRAPTESMTEVVDWLRTRDGIGASSLVVQLFDPEDHPSTAELAAIAGRVTAVPVYRWRRPDDEAPVRGLVRMLADRRVDAVTFTSQPAVRFLLDVAAEEGLLHQVVAACNDGAVLPVCVGPVCAEPVAAAGIRTAVWPEPFRLVPMVKLVAERLARPAVAFEEVDARHPDAQGAMAAYIAELDRRFPGGFDPVDALDAGAEPLRPPTGTFLVGRLDGRVVACGGIQSLNDGVAEIKRMWVADGVRGAGVGRRLLAELEARAAGLGHRIVRLDTNSSLVEAIAMYERSGYAPIGRYNDNPYAERFFEKVLR